MSAASDKKAAAEAAAAEAAEQDQTDAAALAAAEAELNENSLTLTYPADGGTDYSVPDDPGDLDGAYIIALSPSGFAAPNWVEAVKVLLGPDQYATFLASKPKVKDFQGIILSYGGLIRLSLGE